MASVEFVGPSGQVNYLVGMETGDSNLEPGKVYEVSDELAKKLVASSQQWKASNSKKAKAAEEQTV